MFFEGLDPYWQKRAAEFHARNPKVYEWLVKYARELKAAGRHRSSIQLLWNRVRWDVALATDSEDGFKLCQNYNPWYGRFIMEQEPDLAGMFDIRSRYSHEGATEALSAEPEQAVCG